MQEAKGRGGAFSRALAATMGIVLAMGMTAGAAFGEETQGMARETAESAASAGGARKALPDIVGVNHINSFYSLTDKDFVNEGADQILRLGSRVIKLVIRDGLDHYYNINMSWPEITNLVQAAELPPFKEVFAKPFSTIVLMTFAPGKDIHYFTEGMTEEDAARESAVYYEFAKHLLTTYAGSGKTFVLQNWEGDWVLTPPDLPRDTEPDPVAVEGMIRWLNARQDGVDRARDEVGMNGVRVFHAAEVNLVEKAMQGRGCVTNSVLPHTRCDLYSYSAYDTMAQSEALFREAMAYLKEKAPDSAHFGSDNVYIGEYGWPESLVTEEHRLEMVRYTVEAGLEFKAPYLLFWELYCDGPKGPIEGKATNEDFVGNWLIRPDGSETPVWRYFEALLAGDGASEVAVAGETSSVYLSDVVYGIGKYELDYGKVLGLDTTSYPLWPKAIPGDPIAVGGETYAKGLGASPGDIVIALDGEYAAFDATVGIQDGDEGTASFRVTVDGEVAFDALIASEDGPQAVRVPLDGAQRMVLTTGSTVRANWADAKLLRAGDGAPTVGPDMAPFARVAAWDPERMDGVRVDRLTEYPAEDVFLETALAPDADGAYEAPLYAGGERCIGLQWLEARKLHRAALAFEGPAPDVATARLEAWVRKDPMALDGYSPWQGKWIPAEGAIRVADGAWEMDITGAENRQIAEGTYKIRWVFDGGDEPVRVRRLTANTTSRWAEAELFVEAPAGTRVSLYNGAFVDGEASASVAQDGPLALRLRYTTPRPWGLDRTVLHVETPEQAFGVAVDDVLAHDVVYVAPADVCVRTADGDAEAARARAASEPTILEQVRALPDQTFAQALEANYMAVQDRGPTMLSLAADNRKVIVRRSGEVGFGPTYLDFVQQRNRHLLTPTFGTGAQHTFSDTGVGDLPGYSRRLDGGWLPIPHIRVEEDGVAYHQLAHVAPWDDPKTGPSEGFVHPTPVCVVTYRIENAGAAPAEASLTLTATADGEADAAGAFAARDGRWAMMDGERVLAVIDAPPSPLTCTANGGTLEVRGTCPPETTLTFHAYMPLEWTPTEGQWAALRDGEALRERTETYWRDRLAPAMDVSIPDALLEDLLKASRVHCFLAARNEDDGAQIDAWISSAYYASLDTESHAILHGMDLWGQHDFARRTLAFFLERHKPEGYLSHGYTLIGTGQHLWWATAHYLLTRDDAWWADVTPKLAAMCRWTAAQTEKTKRTGPDGAVVPQYGLVPPGTVADWQDWGHIYSANGYYYAGLAAAAEALGESGWAEAEAFAAAADALRENIRRAYRWTVARMPVVPRRDGAWIPGSPFQALCPGPSTQFFPNYGLAWLYDAELGPHHLVDQGVFDAYDPETTYMADDLEDRQFIDFTFGAVTAEATRADWFNRGGYARAQPYYGRFVQMHAVRDDVKAFLRSYFNQLGVMFNREDLTIYENPGASVWNKTFETGNFLQQSRRMFVEERGDALWLAPFLPSAWLEDGKRVAVDRAPTAFGAARYEIVSHTAEGFVEARITAPERAETVVIRLRHPEGKTLVRAEATGARARASSEGSSVHLRPEAREITVRAYYE